MTDSDLGPSLDDPRRAGVFFVTSEDLATVEAAADDAGLLARRIDLRGCEDKAALLLRVANALDFPAGLGRNWDALDDALRDLSWLQAPGYVLLFDQAGDLRDADETSFDTLLEILDEAAGDWGGHEVPFWAFLSLPDEEFEDEQAM